MRRTHVLTFFVLSTLAAGCPTSSVEVNPFMAYTETFGVGSTTADDRESGAAGGTASQLAFRRDMTVTFQNNHPAAELNVSFVAWVDIGRVRTAEQQDALLAGGYKQLAQEIRLGSAVTLPLGTFVYDGGGTAGATAIVLDRAQAAATDDDDDEQVTAAATTMSMTIITPDGMLAFAQPPVSCDSVAFYFTDDGEPLTAVPVAGAEAPFAGANGESGLKTLAQVDVYQCDPFRPGLFLQLSGGTAEENEYFEGEEVTFVFNAAADANGDFANVTIGTATTEEP